VLWPLWCHALHYWIEKCTVKQWKQEYHSQTLRLRQLTLRKAGKLLHCALSVQQHCVLPASHVLVIRRTTIAFTRCYTAYLTAICMCYVELYARWWTAASVSACVSLWTDSANCINTLNVTARRRSSTKILPNSTTYLSGFFLRVFYRGVHLQYMGKHQEFLISKQGIIIIIIIMSEKVFFFCVCGTGYQCVYHNP